MGAKKGDEEFPSAPGWYPDPWSATGSGERYFDGKQWGTTERPRARHTSVAVEDRPAEQAHDWGKWRKWTAVIAVLAGVAFAISYFQHHGSSSETASPPPDAVAPGQPHPTTLPK